MRDLRWNIARRRGRKEKQAPASTTRDAKMQFVARQEVVAPRALPVSTSRYLRRVRSIVPSRDDKLPRRAATATIPPTCGKERESESERGGGEGCGGVRDKSIRDRYRSPVGAKSERGVRGRFEGRRVRERGHYLIDAALRFIIKRAGCMSRAQLTSQVYAIFQ